MLNLYMCEFAFSPISIHVVVAELAGSPPESVDGVM